MVDIPKVKYSGAIRQIEVGSGDKALAVGGRTAYPFHLFEGDNGSDPRIAFEINDIAPTEWAAPLAAAFSDVWGDPVKWAKKCVDKFGAEIIHLELVGTDPNGADKDAAHAIKVVGDVAKAIKVPLVVWGSGNVAKDTEILRAVASGCDQETLMIGPVQEENYKQIGAQIIANNHKAIPSSPIDINLAKQLNILLGNLGVPDTSLIMDPTIGGLGYGMEYSYSVMERAVQAAMTQKDEKLQLPLYCNLGKEVWKVKEAKLSAKDAPELGDPEKRGILMEALTAVACLLAGGDVLVLRHPETATLLRSLIKDLLNPPAREAVEYKLPEPVAPLAGAAKPAPKKAAPAPAAAKPAPKKEEKPAAAAAPAPKKEEAPAPKKEEKPAAAAAPKEEAPAAKPAAAAGSFDIASLSEADIQVFGQALGQAFGKALGQSIGQTVGGLVSSVVAGLGSKKGE